MASSQRHNADKTAVAEGSRKHRSSRRVDPSDPVAVHSYQQKSSSKDRTSAALQPSSYGVPQLSQPVTQRTQDGHTDAYSLRAYIRKKTDKRSPRSSNEKFPVGDDPYAPRQDYATATSYVQPSTSTHLYATPVEQKSRDPTSSSRYHRERDKDWEKSSKRDAERSSTRDRTVETSEERERRRRKEKEAAREKERVSKDRDRHKEKERSKTRETRPTVDHRQADAASVYQAYGQSAAPAQRSADRLPSVYPDTPQPLIEKSPRSPYLPQGIGENELTPEPTAPATRSSLSKVHKTPVSQVASKSSRGWTA
ncbi:hypothetical protein BN946_scf184863.g24 [Trametes cinnabarina]|uniref:Uncharacterized protein n=1 Tax=Pycnoporus cinnabarinus TaxID=5643 RepID=A0A060SFQ8_PYCCI|nr:hypothetical protein BN946_scf184863.g24 [Trametes cinnabarina]